MKIRTVSANTELRLHTAVKRKSTHHRSNLILRHCRVSLQLRHTTIESSHATRRGILRLPATSHLQQDHRVHLLRRRPISRHDALRRESSNAFHSTRKPT